MNKNEIILTALITTWYLGYTMLLIVSLKMMPEYIVKPISKFYNHLKKRFNKIWNNIIEDQVWLSSTLFVFTLIIFSFLLKLKPINSSNFLEGIQVEFFGILFDVLVLLVFANYLSRKGDKNKRINQYHNEIDDFRYWKSDEAKFRIIGNIKRLNRENETKINLIFIDISGKINSQMQIPNSKFSDSNLLETKFEHCNLFESEFMHTICHYTNFKDAVLIKSNFSDSHLQGVNFYNSKLSSSNFANSTIISNTDFRFADLRFAQFSNCTFGEINFDWAEVSKDFSEDIKKWDLQGTRVLDNYIILIKPQGNSGKNRYVLTTKNYLNGTPNATHIKISDIEY